MITPARINDISNEIATIYAHISDELLVNIGKHITSPNWTHTASWEIQKLAELGQLTAENAAIINKWIKAIPPELRNAMEETRKAALDEIEKQMDAAAKRGYVTPPVTDSSVAVFQDMQNQAADRLNLVNTTMLQSSVDQYQRAIVLTEEEYNRLMAQCEATQEVLNDAAMSTATGVETRRVAVRRAIGRISAEGLTGFIDRAGRHWTPEAYVNMDVRTTVHNTAIQATRARMNDFGTSVFQVSSHAGARPLCYPYQGKFYSWDNTAGTIELGDGSVVSYEPINSTSYGQPAGVFGCNCGHYPIPIIAGVTIPHGADNIQPEEENDKAYALSQEQRALERKIREAKRLVEMAGDTATPEDKQKVKDAQAQMRAFINRTGRTRRYDREQIGGTPQTKAPAVPKAPEPPKQAEPDIYTLREAANQSSDKYEFWMNLDADQQAIFKASGMTLDDAFAMLKTETQPESEWKPAAAGGAESFAVHHLFDTKTTFNVIPPRSDGWMADATGLGVINVREGGLGENWDFIISHEAGHQLANMSAELQQIIITNPNNILGRYNTKRMFFDGVYGEYNPDEAFATSVSNYIRHPDAMRERYPETYQAIDELFRASPSARDYVLNMMEEYKREFLL